MTKKSTTAILAKGQVRIDEANAFNCGSHSLLVRVKVACSVGVWTGRGSHVELIKRFILSDLLGRYCMI